MKFKKYLFFIHIWVLNPILNILPWFWIDIFYDNQSHIGNAMHHPLYLFLWAISSAWGFYKMSILYWQKRKFSYVSILHRFLCIGMPVSCLIPYQLQNAGWLNDLHIWLAIGCVGGFIVEWLYYFYKQMLLISYEKILVLVFVFCTFLLFVPGHITSAAQTSFSLLVNITLYQLVFSDNHDKISA